MSATAAAWALTRGDAQPDSGYHESRDCGCSGLRTGGHLGSLRRQRPLRDTCAWSGRRIFGGRARRLGAPRVSSWSRCASVAAIWPSLITAKAGWAMVIIPFQA